MARLVARTPAEGLLPLKIGTVTLSEAIPEAITSVMSPQGRQSDQAHKALKSATGAGFPEPGQTTGADGVRVVWTGPGQALVLGPRVAAEGLRTTDQSDAWAVLRVEGDEAEAVLARLVPLDLRLTAFGTGRTARTMLGHMTGSVTRIGEKSFEIMAFRSMAATAVHEIERAMKGVAGRKAKGPA